MKKSFTLIVFTMLLATLTFAQKKNHHLKSTSTLSHLRDTSNINNHIRFLNLTNNANISYDYSLKSAQTEKIRLDSITSQSWDNTNKQWITNYKVDYSYDTNGIPVQYINYEYNESSNKLEKHQKEEYSYDSNGNRMYYKLYDWNASDNKWEIFITEDFSYDSNNILIQDVFQIFDTDTVKYKGKIDFSYNTEDKINFAFSYNWDKTTNQWQDTSYRIEYTYNADGTLKQSLSYYLDNDDKWQSTGKSTCSYDTNGNITQYLGYSKQDSEWAHTTTTEYVYDSYNNIIREDYLEHNTLEVGFRTDYSYDNTYSYNDLILPPFNYPYEDTYNGGILDNDIFFNHKIDSSYYYYKEEGTDWEFEEKDFYYYSNANITATNNTKQQTVKIFPNPVETELTFSLGTNNSASFELFDMQGRKILEKEVYNNKSINIEMLNKGMYLYLINIDGTIQKGKIVKQ